MRIVLCLVLALLVVSCTPTGVGPLPSPSLTPTVASASTRSAPPPTTSPTATLPPFSATLSGPIQRLDANIGFAATETGLVGTDDAGMTWSARARMDGALFSELRFVDATRGWAIVERWAPGTICLSPTTPPPCWTVMTTSDGGRSWLDRLTVPGNQLGTAPMTSLQAIDDQQAWVVVQNTACVIQGCIGELRASRDGGRSWSIQLSRVGGLGPVRFASATRGWFAATRPGDAQGGADILASPDGGVTWTTVYRATTPVISIDAASEREAWILTRDGGYCTASNCSRYELLHAGDGGTSWISLGNPKDQALCSGGLLHGPVFANPLLALMAISLGAGGAIAGSGGLMRTRDGGRTWDCRTTPKNVSYISAADPQRWWVRSDPGPGSVTGPTPELIATDDGGDTWHALRITVR